MTPTQRTLAALGDLGYTSGMVERWIAKKPFGIRKDLFGIIDIIAIKAGEASTLGMAQTQGQARRQGDEIFPKVP